MHEKDTYRRFEIHSRTYFVSFFIYVCRGGDWGVEM